MASNKGVRKSSSSLGWVMLLVGATMVGALAAYIKTSKAEPPTPSSSDRPIERQVAPTHANGNVSVLTPRYEGDRLEYNQERKAVPAGNDRVVFAVNEYLNNAHVAPVDARLEKCSIEKGLAKLSFSPSFEKTYGAEDEKTLLDGILRTMGQFKEVERVQFLIGTSPLETLGNVDLTEPQEVIRPEK